MIAHSWPGCTRIAQMDVPLDDAIEAEAVAQLLDPDLKEARLDSVIQVYDINDLDALVARFVSDKRVQSFEMDPELFAAARSAAAAEHVCAARSADARIGRRTCRATRCRDWPA